MRKKGDSCSREWGFTSAELLIVITIGTILAVIAGAGYRLYERESPVKYAAQRLNRAAATARSYAVTNNDYYALIIDTKFQNFWIDIVDKDGVTIDNGWKVTAPESLGDKVSLVAWNGTIDGRVPEERRVVFQPDGSSGNAKLWLKMGDSASKVYYAVRIYGPTGQSRVMSDVEEPTQTLTALPLVADPAGLSGASPMAKPGTALRSTQNTNTIMQKKQQRKRIE